KVPELGREEWPSLVQTLRDIASNAASEPKQPEAAVKIAVEGWYGDYIREAYENWMQRKDDLESLIGFAARFDSMAEMLAQLVLLNSETSDRSIERSEDCVRLTTVHQAKGLEFPAVFVIGLADGQFPIKRAVEEGNVEEERRLFYVAVTRAMDELYMVFPIISVQAGPMTRSEPSRFIREVPPSCFETVAMHQHRY
ncbi:MAG TPA: ATP-dependent helicase, partial [Opitutales bacterium]|nr:ATP-dependent helicase [Opitutales bacterium]